MRRTGGRDWFLLDKILIIYEKDILVFVNGFGNGLLFRPVEQKGRSVVS